MRERLEELLHEAATRIEHLTDDAELQALEQQYLSRKGELAKILKSLGSLNSDERRELGQYANQVKDELRARYDAKVKQLRESKTLLPYQADLSLPGIPPESGGLHPVTQMAYDLNDAFRSLNFEIYREHEITSEYAAFDCLNFPDDHPARESMDTYWIEGTEDKKGVDRLCPRPHLTGASVRCLKEVGAPARFVYPGMVYRNESTDAGHERAFSQYEALVVEKHFPFASGKFMIDTILSKVFGREVKTRMRAGFFPFVEPGFEIDMECQVCGGKGCSVCKGVGWIEVMPGGTPHPNVLRAANIDPDEYTGFYINIGLDRLVMMRYGIDDVRYFHSGDLRFLKQFH